MLKNKSKKTRQEINEESRELKRKRKHKGLPSGSRFNGKQNNKKTSNIIKDPRIGSKKPISLVQTDDPIIKVNQPKKVKLTPEQELDQLENDTKLDHLLDLVEQGKTLTNEQQSYLDNKLDRIDQLMKQLGYEDNDFDDELEEPKEDIVSLLKRN
ncbi:MULTISPECIES: Der GTPase-activating protein YihI [unclassified Gilliamella]|uniref:Der GTPase-activating protein YihI n=1 Tax=unclassified Gilliamella TaxID=2685620 RepID=UPI0008108E03|nr:MULTISPECIES: Der GTPase-activating protein YihI [Gilliamella]MCX8581064.1 GTPase-activating protein [Gilliamella sp. B3482]MCX8585872.1 GTPase-activating protein [Gilliamella sp. B3562]MCX8594846.1 GTPase-activating protein [Gilliamella sp. B3367]MCX8660788.1 GTPase-activating protein [Gilliamella sp. B2772]MCX8674837.1 GTPase-activating protein [Gilliamella sp. B3023]